MSEDKKIMNRVRAESQLRMGRDIPHAEAVENFAKADSEARIQYLLNTFEKSDEDLSTVDMQDAAERLTLERKLRQTHERLRRAGR